MAIILDKVAGKTICICNACGVADETEATNGVVVDGWGTGNLWLDVSLSSIKQTPICFCPSCFANILGATSFNIASADVPTEEPEGDTDHIDDDDFDPGMPDEVPEA